SLERDRCPNEAAGFSRFRRIPETALPLPQGGRVTSVKSVCKPIERERPGALGAEQRHHSTSRRWTFGTVVLSCVCRPRRIYRKIARSIRIFGVPVRRT